MSDQLELALSRLALWRTTPPVVTPLSGGLTNHNYRVQAGDEVYVLRLGGNKTDLLGIDRHTEQAATRAAAAVGLAPEVIAFLEPEGWLVTRFIGGRLIPPEEMRQPARIAQAAAALRRVHTMAAIPGTFSPFQVVRSYTRLAQEHGVENFPPDFADLMTTMAAVEAALARHPFTPAPCHNDLLSENFLLEEATDTLRLIDWEYAGMGDPFFDLGNFAAQHRFTDAHDDGLLAAYLGAADPRAMARLKLLKCMSDFREAIWGVLQQGVSQLDFDFRGYADTYFARLRAGFGDPRLVDWMDHA